MEKPMCCPICVTGEFEYRKATDPNGAGTHYWVCDQCPGILMEWIGTNDSRRVHEALSRPEDRGPGGENPGGAPYTDNRGNE